MRLETPDFALELSAPSGWDVARSAVPNLVHPHELVAMSNRPIQPTPADSSQPRPMIASLDPAAIFVWAYFQHKDDPEMTAAEDLPDYERFTLPLDYSDSEVFPAYEAREWDPRNFLWRRVGLRVRDTWLTVWMWEGMAAKLTDVDALKAIVKSIQLA